MRAPSSLLGIAGALWPWSLSWAGLVRTVTTSTYCWDQIGPSLSFRKGSSSLHGVPRLCFVGTQVGVDIVRGQSRDCMDQKRKCRILYNLELTLDT